LSRYPDLGLSTSFASLLLEEKQTRRAAAAESKLLEARAFDSSNGKRRGRRFCGSWDVFDFGAIGSITVRINQV
jgi:hypothetical protein